MLRLSSNFTLFYKIFVPTSWASFFGLFGMVILLLDPSDEPFLTSAYFKIGYWVFFILFAALFYFTVIQLKRVEYENEHLFFTNYFKTVKLHVSLIEKITFIDIIVFKVGVIHLKQKGTFGKKIKFLTKQATFEIFSEKYPQLVQSEK